MRTTQFYGLSREAEMFLEDNVARRDGQLCPHCHKAVELEIDKWAEGGTTGMFEEVIPFYAYKLKDGRTAKEVLQTEWWSSGPMIFTKLVDSDGKDLAKWSEGELKSFV